MVQRSAIALRSALVAGAGFLFAMLPSVRADGEELQPFRDGERWVALGDSITHTGSYRRFVALYYATRFPERRILSFNAGIAGDTAERSLPRLGIDVFPHKPTVTTVMFGMNDVGRYLYETNAQPDGQEEKRQARLDAYRNHLRKVASALRESGTEIILLTPTPFDDTVAASAPNAPGCNAALARCAEIVRETAREFDAPVIDLHAPMTTLNQDLQKADPSASLIGSDRIHPGDPGHLVMAYLFLKAQNAPGVISDVHIDAEAGKVLKAENAGVTGLVTDGNGISFDMAAKALPFPVPASAEQALAIVPFTEELNREILQVSGLMPGRYALTIDGTEVGIFESTALAEGVPLAENARTPQHRQAMEVLALDTRRFELEKNLRVLVYVEGMLGHRMVPDAPSDGFYFDAAARELLARPGFGGWVADQVRNYLTLKPREAELRKELANSEDAFRRAALPVSHRYILARQP